MWPNLKDGTREEKGRGKGWKKNANKLRYTVRGT